MDGEFSLQMKPVDHMFFRCLPQLRRGDFGELSLYRVTIYTSAEQENVLLLWAA